MNIHYFLCQVSQFFPFNVNIKVSIMSKIQARVQGKEKKEEKKETVLTNNFVQYFPLL